MYVPTRTPYGELGRVCELPAAAAGAAAAVVSLMHTRYPQRITRPELCMLLYWNFPKFVGENYLAEKT